MDEIPKSPGRKDLPMIVGQEDDIDGFIKSMERSTRKILQTNASRRRNKIMPSSSHSPTIKKSSAKTKTSSTNIDNYIGTRLKNYDDFEKTVEDTNDTKQSILKLQAVSLENTANQGGISKAKWREATKQLVKESDRKNSSTTELNCSELRKKYRCLPNNNEDTKSPAEITVRSEEEKRLAIEKHPSYKLLESHIQKENEKLRKLDEEVIRMKAASVLDRHAEWSSRIKSLGEDMFREKKKISFNAEEENALFKLEIEREGICTKRSESATPSSIKDDVYLNMEGIPTNFDPEQTMSPRIEKPNEQLYRIAPEIWPLIVCEPLYTPGSSMDDKGILVSMYRIHERTSYNVHQKCFVYGEQPFWMVELYHQADCSEEFYFSKESDIIPFIVSLPKGGGDCLIQGDTFLVHSELSDMQAYKIYKTIHVQSHSMKTFASIQLKILSSITSSSEGEKQSYFEIASTQIDIPAFEIIIRLKKHNTWRAMEKDPWYKSSNENSLWLNLLNLIDLDLEKTKERNEVVWRWIDDGYMDQSSMESHDWKMTVSAWNQPSVPPLEDAYLTSVNHAYSYIFHLCNTCTSESEIFNHLRLELVDSNDQKVKFQKIWNERNEGHPPLALRRTGLDRIYSETLLQGSCVIDTLHFPNPIDNGSEDTIQATVVATFDRDDESMNTPTVSVSVALDTPIIGPAFVESSYEYVLPPPASTLPLDDSALKLMGEKGPIDVPFQSAFENHEPSTIVVLDPAGEKGINKTKQHPESRRCLPTFNEQNFRVKCFAHPMEIQEKPYVTQPFGISKNAVTPNKTTVHPPIQWHSEEICTSVLSRERTPRELYDLIMKDMPNRLVPTPNDPLLATVRFNKNYKIDSVEFIPKQEFLQKQKELATLKEEKRQKDLLASKIEAAQHIVDQREEKERLELLAECTRNTHGSVNVNENPSTEKLIPPKSTTSVCMGGKIENEEKAAYDLIQSLRKRQVMPCPDPERMKTVCKPKLVGMIDPSTLPEERRRDMSLLRVKPQTYFISNVLEDRVQMARARDENKRYQEMILNASQQQALEYILRIPMKDTDPSTNKVDTVGIQYVDSEILKSEVRGSYERRVEAMTNMQHHHHQRQEDEYMLEQDNITKADREYQAIVAVKSLNFTILEELLDGYAINVETQDEFGNTLFILACQQGSSKKMIKFLLRRGANIDAQNHTGNTALHYLYEYEHTELADYLLSKGADDSLLNSHGFTCYEGVTDTKIGIE